MKTKQFDALFFKVFNDVCQAKAVYGYTSEEKLADRTLSVKTGVGTDGYKDKIIKDILLVSMLTLEKEKKINYERFEIIAKAILLNYLKKKGNDILEEPSSSDKNKTKKEKIIIEIEESLEKIYDMIEPDDFETIIKRYTRIKMSLNAYVETVRKAFFKLGTRYQFKKEYGYFLEYHFLKKADTQFDIIKVTSSGIKNEEIYFDLDLNLLSWYLKKIRAGKTFRYYIIYDTVSLKRLVIPYKMTNGLELKENLFVALFQTDTNSFYKRIGQHCEDCNQKNICFASMFSNNVRRHFHQKKEKGRPVGENLAFMKNMIYKIRTKNFNAINKAGEKKDE